MIFPSNFLEDRHLDIMMQALSDVRELRNPEKRREREKKGKDENDKKEMEEQERRENDEQEGARRKKETTKQEKEKQEVGRLDEEKRMSENWEQEQIYPVSPPAKDSLNKAQSETSSAEPQTAETGDRGGQLRT